MNNYYKDFDSDKYHEPIGKKTLVFASIAMIIASQVFGPSLVGLIIAGVAYYFLLRELSLRSYHQGKRDAKEELEKIRRKNDT